jgi:hypothetical protein
LVGSDEKEKEVIEKWQNEERRKVVRLELRVIPGKWAGKGSELRVTCERNK